MTTPEAWVRAHGIVLQSAHGPLPNLAEYVAGEPIRGSWWGHPSGHAIFAVLNQVRDSPDVVACRLFEGKVTLVHKCMWPALVRLADRFPVARLAAIEEQHTASGAHMTIEIPFPILEMAAISRYQSSTQNIIYSHSTPIWVDPTGPAAIAASYYQESEPGLRWRPESGSRFRLP